MGARRIRREQRAFDMALSRRTKGMVKTKERARRKSRLVDIIKKTEFPYTPSVMSWISAQLGKPSKQITKAEVESLIAKSSA